MKKLSKFYLSIFTCALIFVGSLNISFAQGADPKINIKTARFKESVAVKIKQSQLMAFRDPGTLKDRVLDDYYIMSNAVKGGTLNLINCSISKGLAFLDTGATELNLENTRINGSVIINCDHPVKINLNGNSYIKNLYLCSPVIISGNCNDTYARVPVGIDTIELASDYKNSSTLVVDLSLNTIKSYAKALNLKVTKTVNRLSAANPVNVTGSKNIMVTTKLDANKRRQFIYDLSEITYKKGYNSINDATSYQAMLEYFKDNKLNYQDEALLIVKNPGKNSTTQLNNVIIENYNNYLNLDIKSLFSYIFTVPNTNYGVLKLYICYGDDNNKRPLNQNWIQAQYSQIKDLGPVDYVRAVNKLIAQHIVYTDDINKNTVYDAIYNKNCLCEGYAKLGHEFLERKFGPENTMLISNKDHIWNMVKLDNKWYHVDFTYNDPTTNPVDLNYFSEKYLLKSDKSIVQEADRKPWNKNNYPVASIDYQLN